MTTAIPELITALRDRCTVADNHWAAAFVIVVAPTFRHLAYLPLASEDIAELAADCGLDITGEIPDAKVLWDALDRAVPPSSPATEAWDVALRIYDGNKPIGALLLPEAELASLTTLLQDSARRRPEREQLRAEHPELAAEVTAIAAWPESELAAEIDDLVPQSQSEICVLYTDVLASVPAHQRMAAIRALGEWAADWSRAQDREEGPR